MTKLNNKKIGIVTKGAMWVFIPLVMFSGCSLKNPFGIGYESSVSEESKTFGITGSPKDIYKYRDKIRAVQNDYLSVDLDTELFFAVDKAGNILIKDDREGNWVRYDISEWKGIIDQAIKEKEELIKEQDRLAQELEKEEAKNIYKNKGGFNSETYRSDIPITKGNDLSVQYEKQGPLLTTRTKVGDIIRDTGLIQQTMIFNYIDTAGDLISSHEVFVVVKDPKWIVGEKTPKNVGSIGEIPTPLSTELLKTQNRTNQYQEDIVNTFNSNKREGVLKSIINEDPRIIKTEKNKDINLINDFISEKK